MRTLVLTILTMGIVLTAGHAQAQTYDPAYPVCLYVVSFGATPYYRCSYTTMAQCRASANGQMCSLNPYYAGATAPVRRNNRRYHRHHHEPYYGASQGYAPGEKEQFLGSVRRPG